MWNLVALNNLDFFTKRSLFGFKQISATDPVPTRPERWTQLNELRRERWKHRRRKNAKSDERKNPRNIFCYDNVGTFFKSKNHFQLIRIEIRLECAQCNRKTSSDDIVDEKRLRNSPRGLKMEIFWHQQHDKFLHERIKRGLEIDAMRWMTLSFSAAHRGRGKKRGKIWGKITFTTISGWCWARVFGERKQQKKGYFTQWGMRHDASLITLTLNYLS